MPTCDAAADVAELLPWRVTANSLLPALVQKMLPSKTACRTPWRSLQHRSVIESDQGVLHNVQRAVVLGFFRSEMQEVPVALVILFFDHQIAQQNGVAVGGAGVFLVIDEVEFPVLRSSR